MEDKPKTVKIKQDQEVNLEEINKQLEKENAELRAQIKVLVKQNQTLEIFKDLYQTADNTLNIVMQAINMYQTTVQTITKSIKGGY